MKFNRKGIEMSINIIVMLVIGLTVLGLVIGFVQNLIGGATTSFNQELDAAEQARAEAVRALPGVFAIGPNPIIIGQGGSKNLFIKVTNAGSTDYGFDPTTSASGTNTFTEDAAGAVIVQSDGGNGLIEFTNTAITGNCQPKFVSPPLSLAPGATDILGLTVDTGAAEVANSCNSGDAFYLTATFRPLGSSESLQYQETITIEISD